MAVEVSLLDEDAQKFVKKLERLVGDVTEKRDRYVDALGAVVFQDIISHFEQEQGSEGKWKRWSDAYSEHMAKIGKGGNRILQDTGRLRGSFVPGNRRVETAGVVWFNNAQTPNGFPYASAHNEGGMGMPMRDFMWLSDSAVEKIQNITLQHILEE